MPKQLLNKFDFFEKQKLMLAVEYGMTISDVAKHMNVEVTREMMERAEEVIVNEFKKKSPEDLAVEMAPNILAIFEPKH